MKVWAARNLLPVEGHGPRTHIRIQDEPLDPILWGRAWELRQGDISEQLWDALGQESDPVEIERLHQETWRSLEASTP